MEEVLNLYHKLLRIVLPTLKQVESALGDKDLCPKSRLLAARTILFETDHEFHQKLNDYYKRHMFESYRLKEDSSLNEHFLFERFDFNGKLFLN